MSSSVAPVAAAFLERLLFDTEPIEAISTLSSIWSCRARHEVVRFGLSEPEHLMQLCLIYTGEVSNGGHPQFFLNRGGRYGSDTLNALHATGLSLRRAIDTFPSDAAPANQVDFEAVLQKLPQDRRHALDDMDREAMRLLPVVDTQLLIYARANRRQVLVPETPLALRVGRSAT